MATWQSTNIVLTQKGRLLLSILQNAEADPAVISKVATASGRVAESNLYNQTALTDEKLPCKVLSKEAYDSGSIINVQCSNAELTADIGSYSVNQIGVFMRHPDIDSNTEFLYMIAQCDDGTADSVPLPQVTPVTLNYSLYILHGQEATITVTIDTTAAVPLSMFTPVKDNVDNLLVELAAAKGDIVINQTNITNHNTRIAALEAREDLTPRVVALETWKTDTNPIITGLSSTVTSHGNRLTTAEGAISTLQSTVSSHTTTLGSHTTTLSDHETRITTNLGSINTLTTNLATLTGVVNGIKKHPSRTDNPHNVTLAQVVGDSVVPVNYGGTGRSTLTSGALLMGNDTTQVSLISKSQGALYCSTSNSNPSYGTLPVTCGGTGRDGLIANAVLLGNNSNQIKQVVARSGYIGAFYADGISAPPDFGTLPVKFGGTGITSISQGDLLVGDSSNTISTLSIPSSPKALCYVSGDSAPSYRTLPVSAGGTGVTSISPNAILVGNNSTNISYISNNAGALISNGNSRPSFGIVPVSYGGTGRNNDNFTSQKSFGKHIENGNLTNIEPGHYMSLLYSEKTTPIDGYASYANMGVYSTSNHKGEGKITNENEVIGPIQNQCLGCTVIGDTAIQWGVMCFKGSATKEVTKEIKFHIPYKGVNYSVQSSSLLTETAPHRIGIGIGNTTNISSFRKYQDRITVTKGGTGNMVIEFLFIGKIDDSDKQTSSSDFSE